MTSRPWTTTEEQVLRHFATLGVDGVSQLLERSHSSVKDRARAINVSLVKTDNDIDLQLTPARILRYVRQSPTFQLCPMCGQRLAMMVTTGMCRVCHLDRLIDIRNEQLDVIARERRLTKLRQDKKRMRSCDRCGRAFYPRPSSTDLYCASCGGSDDGG